MFTYQNTDVKETIFNVGYIPSTCYTNTNTLFIWKLVAVEILHL